MKFLGVTPRGELNFLKFKKATKTRTYKQKRPPPSGEKKKGKFFGGAFAKRKIMKKKQDFLKF